ncbi:hypothetical protein [Microbacterium sp. W4I20]|uniref:hypothetical protein n=1 Tax=Microbacterium sp. W4I20 TaxID=3042262 RepID=UPI00358E886A
MATRRVRGTGTVFQDQRGYWTVALPLPSQDGTRKRSVKRFKSRGAALEHLRDFERSIQGTDLPRSAEYPSGAGVTTVGEWFEYWLAECVYPQLRPRTADGYRSAVITHIVPALGAGTSLSSVRATDIRRMQHLVREGLAATTVRNGQRVNSRSDRRIHQRQRSSTI